MIKVLFFIDKFSYKGSMGGAEKVLITLVNHMDPDKFDITVQTLFPDEFSALLNPNIKYKYCYKKKTSLSWNIFRVEAQLGIVYAMHIKDDYDIEVAYLENETTKVMAASTNDHAKKIAWVHSDFNLAIKNKDEYVHKTAQWYTKFDKIACVSEKCKESFLAMFENNPKVVVVNNVIDDKYIKECANQPLPCGTEKKRTTLCTVGNFTPPKNYLRLLKAAHQLHKEGFLFDWWIIGDGEQRAVIEKYITQNALFSFVHLFGFQKNPYPYMKAADLLVCSSDFEGFSTFATESVILNKPFLTTDCSGMHEILDDYPYGFITSNDDQDFYNGIKKWLLDKVADKVVPYQNRYSTKELVKNVEVFLTER